MSLAGRPRDPDALRTVTIRLADAQYQILSAHAFGEKETVSKLIRYIVDEWVDARDTTPKPTPNGWAYAFETYARHIYELVGILAQMERSEHYHELPAHLRDKAASIAALYTTRRNP